MHYSVMQQEVLEYSALQPDMLALDVTSGLSGHSIAMAKVLTSGRVISCDRDAESLALGEARAREEGVADRIVYRHARFSQLTEIVRTEAPSGVDVLLADLGVSRLQLTSPERGFSFQHDAPLDMRMDRSEEITAADIVNQWKERELADLFFQLGEERRAFRIARAIVRARPIFSAKALADVVESAMARTSGIHPATRVFMSLRMQTNRELEELEALLQQIPAIVRPGGRCILLTFHSLEDRAVKRRFQELARTQGARLLNKHVVTPSHEELTANPASRSAKLRAIEMANN